MFNVSKNQVVITTAPRIFKTHEAPNSTWVWLEDYTAYCDLPDVVKSAEGANVAHGAELGRTKYKVYRYGRDENGRYQNTLTSDNTYVAVVQESRDTAFYWDKPAIKKVIEKVKEEMKEMLDEVVSYQSHTKYKHSREFIKKLLTHKKSLPAKSVLVLLENEPGKCEEYSFKGYVPVEGFYVSPPIFTNEALYSEGYTLRITINNKKTELCTTFLQKKKLESGVAPFVSSGVMWRVEGDTTNSYLHNVMREKTPATQWHLAECEWVVKTRTWRYKHETARDEDEWRHDTVKVLRVCDTLLSSLATDPKRMDFKEQLVMKVFHPDRVARLVGDNWGTGESWLNQI